MMRFLLGLALAAAGNALICRLLEGRVHSAYVLTGMGIYAAVYPFVYCVVRAWLQRG